MAGESPDFTVTAARVSEIWPQGFAVAWETESAGVGHLEVWLDKDGALHCDNETMSPRFLKEVFAKLVDMMVLEDPPELNEAPYA